MATVKKKPPIAKILQKKSKVSTGKDKAVKKVVKPPMLLVTTNELIKSMKENIASI